MTESILVLTVPIFSSLCNLGFRLRREVFVNEQGVPEAEEFEAADLTATHLVALSEGEVCGVMRVVMLPDHAKLGRVAVAAFMRGRGVGEAMIRAAMQEHGFQANGRFYLTAQSDKRGFYTRFGFVAYGAEFLDAGMPHVAMKTY